MHRALANIKSVGFDLDGTLYYQTPAMQEAVSNKAIEAALAIVPSLKDRTDSEKFLRERKKATGSWSKVFHELGVKNPTEILSRAIATADIASLIKKDDRLSQIIRSLSQKYHLFIISGSLRNVAHKKLAKIGIDPAVFSYSFFNDDPHFTSRTEPENFKHFLAQSKFSPEEHVFVGDNPLTDIAIPKSLGVKTIVVGQNLKEADFSVSDIYGIVELLL